MTGPGPAVCARCENVYLVNRSDSWWRWLCMKHPLPQVYNPVTGETVADPPHQYCRKINDGYCDDFSEGPNQLQPKDVANV